MNKLLPTLRAKLTFSPQAPPASRQVVPDSGRVLKTPAFSGHKLFARWQFRNRAGSSSRTRLVSSLLTAGWNTKTSVLVWREKVIGSRVLLYLHQRSARGTGEIESGLLVGESKMSKEIILNDGSVSLVDQEDYPVLSQWKWKKHKNGYAYRNTRSKEDGKKWKTILMHRQIMQAEMGSEIDHINNRKLDNRKENLRFVTHSENCHRRPGVCNVFKNHNKWGGAIYLNNQRIWLGNFKTEEEAKKAYFSAKNNALLPTMKASPSGPDFVRRNRKRSGGDDLVTALAMLPTLISRDHRSEKCSPETFEKNSRPLSETIGQCTGYRLSSSFAEWFMGFPPGWTDIDESESRLSETP